MLASGGFEIRHMPFGQVRNLWATHGKSKPLLCMLGHTDVVPPGPEQQWSCPPFKPTERGGNLYGRGACDMKGGVAAMVTAALRFTKKHPNHTGQLAILLTSDEEGPALDGVRRVIQTFQTEKTHIDMCLVGEPSCDKYFGDTIKNGRRGSLSASLMVQGTQGHIAYPAKANNPIISTVRWAQMMLDYDWGAGNEYFQPVSFQFSALSADGGAHNIIPGTLRANFNFRYGTDTNEDILRETTERLLRENKLQYSIDWAVGSKPFLTEKGPLVDAVSSAVKSVVGKTPQLATVGGTSDGRYIAPTGAQVVEFGVINDSAHKIDEHASIKDLESLSEIYEEVLCSLLGPGAS
jgi:succinyl-diaminopimelate desuccinylase